MLLLFAWYLMFCRGIYGREGMISPVRGDDGLLLSSIEIEFSLIAIFFFLRDWRPILLIGIISCSSA